MSRTNRSSSAVKLEDYAPVFAALGDATRLALVAKLSKGKPLSIAQLTRGSKISRQAVTKHLRMLATAGLVEGAHSGRQNLFHLDPRPFKDMCEYLTTIDLLTGS